MERTFYITAKDLSGYQYTDKLVTVQTDINVIEAFARKHFPNDTYKNRKITLEIGDLPSKEDDGHAAAERATGVE